MLTPPRHAVMEIVTGPSELERHRAEIERLVPAALGPNAFFEPFFLLPALRHLDGASQVFCVLVYRDDPVSPRRVLIGLFPLRRSWHVGWLPVPALSLWCHRYCFLGTPLIHRDWGACCLRALLAWHRNGPYRHSLLRLPLIAWDGAFAATLRDTLRTTSSRGLVTSTHRRALLQRADSADRYLVRATSTKRRRNYRRLKQRLSERGELVFRTIGPDDPVEPWIERFLGVEQSGWKGHRGSALGSRPWSRAFFVEMATDAHRRTQLMMASLDFEGRPIAMKCNLLTGDAGYAFKIAYDESYAAFSPGVLLEVEHVRELHRRASPHWMDSCANPGLPPERLWKQWRHVATVAVSPAGGWGALVHAALRRDGGMAC